MAEMAIKKKRPKNLDLPTIRLPLPGILSIIHRISGAVLFLLLPFFQPFVKLLSCQYLWRWLTAFPCVREPLRWA